MIAGLLLATARSHHSDASFPWEHYSDFDDTLRAMRSVLSGPVVVVVRGPCEGLALLRGGCRVVVLASVPETAGQAAALASGLASLEGESAVLVALGDEPALSPAAIERVVARRGTAPAVRASYEGRPGHPVLLERSVLGRLRDVPGDRAARNVLLSIDMHEVPCDDIRAAAGVDTPAALLGLDEPVGASVA
jgi:CTP:molybdopterin cytidylyltransferase MocA